MASQNVEIAKKGYEAFGAGDIETALADFDDNVEWTIPGNSTLSGTYRGKEQFKEMLGKAAEKNFTTTPSGTSPTAMTWSSSHARPQAGNPRFKPMC